MRPGRSAGRQTDSAMGMYENITLFKTEATTAINHTSPDLLEFKRLTHQFVWLLWLGCTTKSQFLQCSEKIATVISEIYINIIYNYVKKSATISEIL